MKRWLALTILCAPAALAATGQEVTGSKHDLSVTGPGPVRARTETRVCIFCHVSHHAGPSGTNRPDPGVSHQPYASQKMASRMPGEPTGATRLCLSCHDGTIAVGQTVASGLIQMEGPGAGGRLPPGPADLGTDLRGTHPVSFPPLDTQEVHHPSRGDAVKLDRTGQLQCTACHDPHRESPAPGTGNFLVKTTHGGALCLSCHATATYLGSSAHATASAALLAGQPGATQYATVGDSACQACHVSHGADVQGQLLARSSSDSEDLVCLRCHNGQVARLDVARQAAKPFAHGAPHSGSSGHDASEGPTNAAHRLPEASPAAPRHGTCVDCHDGHATFHSPAVAPRASGALAGVWGVDRNGQRVQPLQYEYQLCFKCHADSANQPQARGPTPPDSTRRTVIDVNLRRVFDPSGPSQHPVVAPGKNPVVPSLIPPLSASSVVYCGDCHASDEMPSSSQVPRGPHGSIYPHLLERNYLTTDYTGESPTAYALCYKCHDRTVVLSTRSSFPLHLRHVVNSATPCSACHASHGVSTLAGNPVNNSHLVDFDISIVKPGPKGTRAYTARGIRGGSCALTCHGKPHDNLAY